jgi:hypothetical protein
MPNDRDADWLIVLAASAGGIPPLMGVVNRLPSTLPAAVVVVCTAARRDSRSCCPGPASTRPMGCKPSRRTAARRRSGRGHVNLLRHA